MIFGEDRNELRRMYFDAWCKHENSSPMTLLESQIAGVIAKHPEYHGLLTDEALARDFAPDDGETNPFLHMGLHLAVGDQISTDRPSGIRREFSRLCSVSGDAHGAEHRMLDCLAECLWEAQRAGSAPDEQRYLDMVRQLP